MTRFVICLPIFEKKFPKGPFRGAPDGFNSKWAILPMSVTREYRCLR